MANQQDQPPDANSRLKARLRPTVPPRDTSLLRRHTEEEEPIVPMRVPFLESTPESAPKPTTEPAPEKPQKPAKAKQNNRASDKPQKLVAFTLRVDESIDNGLKILCNNERITKETFLEAAYLASQENAQIKQHILEIAKDRRQKRRETGVLRRAKSMSKYLG